MDTLFASKLGLLLMWHFWRRFCFASARQKQINNKNPRVSLASPSIGQLIPSKGASIIVLPRPPASNTLYLGLSRITFEEAVTVVHAASEGVVIVTVCGCVPPHRAPSATRRHANSPMPRDVVCSPLAPPL